MIATLMDYVKCGKISLLWLGMFLFWGNMFIFGRHTELKTPSPLDPNILYREHRYNEALSVCQTTFKTIDHKNITLLTNNYSVWQRSLIALERYQEAIDIGLEAKKLAPHDFRIIQGLGEAYYLLGDGEKALVYLQQYTSLNTSDEYIGKVYYYMGEIYLRKGMYQHADIAFSTAIYHSPGVYRWWYRLGFARELAKNKDGARQAYTEALSINPNFIEVRNRLAAL